jgi:hypothetical protein
MDKINARSTLVVGNDKIPKDLVVEPSELVGEYSSDLLWKITDHAATIIAHHASNDSGESYEIALNDVNENIPCFECDDGYYLNCLHDYPTFIDKQNDQGKKPYLVNAVVVRQCFLCGDRVFGSTSMNRIETARKEAGHIFKERKRSDG